MLSSNTIRTNNSSSSCSNSKNKRWLKHKQPCLVKWVVLPASGKALAGHMALEVIPSKQNTAPMADMGE